MTTYNISRTAATAATRTADLFKVGFGSPAQNDAIVRDAEKVLASMDVGGKAVALINGPASLPVALVIGHALAHRYGAVACFDPKLAAYVVSVAHGGDFTVGDLIPAADVAEAA